MRTYVAEFFPHRPKTDEEPERVIEVKADGAFGALDKALIKASGKPTAGKYIWIYLKGGGS
jgi:hypothetical protein